MSNPSMTAQAKEQYKSLAKTLTSEELKGIIIYEDEYYWISHNERAYLIDDMSDGHLANTIKSQLERHRDTDITILLENYFWRTING